MKFYSDIVESYNYIFPYNEQQKKFTLSFLEDNMTESSILDIGCATGNLTFELSKCVNDITGFDLDEEMINYANCSYPDPEKHLRFVCDNMLNIENYFSSDTLDAVISFGNTIVHLGSEREFEALFSKIRTVLKPSGQLLFQIINYDRILKNNIKGLPTIENDYIKFERRYKPLGENLIEFQTDLTIKKTGVVKHNSVTLFALQSDDVEKMLKENGFDNISFYGSFKKAPFNDDSVPLVIAASMNVTPF